jgi:anti-sigma B factor antagonist
MKLTIHVQERKLGGYQVRPEGRLDSITNVGFEEKITKLLEEQPVVLVFDMTDLAYVSSAGLRVIYKTWKTVGEYKGKFLMVNLQPQIKTVMEIIKALPSEQVFTSVEEVDEYLDIVQKKELAEQQRSSE